MNLFELAVKIGVDDQASGKLKDISGKLGNGLKTAAKIGTAAVTAAATGITALTTAAVNNYAEYEQLVGGVETLFGAGGKSLEEYAKKAKASVKDLQQSGVDWGKYAESSWMTAGGGVSGLFDEIKYHLEELKTPAAELEAYLASEYDMDVSDAKTAISSLKQAVTDEGIKKSYNSLIDAQNMVIENANKAYATAGLSANEYMSTVTSFSASLLQSLGGDTNKAADYADQAIRDMSDNANKMGTSMEMIQNAYQGFAKQNYTINLVSAA